MRTEIKNTFKLILSTKRNMSEGNIYSEFTTFNLNETSSDHTKHVTTNGLNDKYAT